MINALRYHSGQSPKLLYWLLYLIYQLYLKHWAEVEDSELFQFTTSCTLGPRVKFLHMTSASKLVVYYVRLSWLDFIISDMVVTPKYVLAQCRTFLSQSSYLQGLWSPRSWQPPALYHRQIHLSRMVLLSHHIVSMGEQVGEDAQFSIDGTQLFDLSVESGVLCLTYRQIPDLLPQMVRVHCAICFIFSIHEQVFPAEGPQFLRGRLLGPENMAMKMFREGDKERKQSMERIS